MNAARFVPAVLVASVALAACGGGGSMRALPSTQFAPRATAGTASATFVMKWGTGSASSAIARAAKFVSPSAKSLTVQVNGGSAQFINAPTPQAGQTSTITIDAPVGTDLFTFKVWDKQGGLGNLLDEGQVSSEIVANRLNTISASLDGVCTQIAITPAPNQPLLESSYQNGVTVGGTQGTPFFRFVGAGPETMVMTPLDADGNVILGNVPAITLSQAGTAAGAPTVLAIASVNNVATVKPIGELPRGTTAQLVAKSPYCSGSQTVAFDASPAIYAYDFKTQPGTLAVYDWSGSQMHLDASAFPGVAAYRWKFGADPATGMLYGIVRDSNQAGRPALFTPTGSPSASAGTFATTLDQPTEATVDTSNHLLYVAYASSPAPGKPRNAGVAAFNADGTAASCSGFCTRKISDPLLGIAYDARNDRLWMSRSVPLALGGSGGSLPYCVTPALVDCMGFSSFNSDPPVTDLDVNPVSHALGVATIKGVLLHSLDGGATQQLTKSSSQSVSFDAVNGDAYVVTAGGVTVFDRSGAAIPTTFPGLGTLWQALSVTVVSPSPLTIILQPSSLTLSAVGQSQTISVASNQPGAPALSETDTCAGIATVAPSGSAAYTVTSAGAGSCTITLTDSGGRTALASVVVTTTILQGQDRRKAVR